MVTIKDVAEQARVSKSTVSRVVSQNGFVSKESRQRVLEAIEILGYRPNTLAQGLKKKRSNVIGVVVPSISSHYFAQLLGGIERVAEQNGINLIVCSGHASLEPEKKAVESLMSRNCDGLILYLQSELTEPPHWDKMRLQIPIVMMGKKDIACSKYSLVVNNEEGGYLATKYFIDQGHRDIFHLAGPSFMADSQDRILGYQRAMQEAQLSTNGKIIQGAFDEQFGHQGIEQILQSQMPCTAIFAADDNIATGVIEALRKRQIRVPQEISVIGFDDMFHARYLLPRLTTVRQPVDQFGATASAWIIKLIAKQEISSKEAIFAPELILRDSVLPPSN